MKPKNIEVELRGSLPPEKFRAVKRFLAREGRLVAKKNRVLIDYSTFIKGQGIKDRNKDIRLRVTNRVPEIIVKLGRWGGSEKREELSVTTKPGTFDLLVKIFAALGYERGMLAVRKTFAYVYKGIEFALVEVPGHSYYYEAEIMVASTGDAERAREKMEKVCGELGLTIYTADQFFAYIKELNDGVNEVFDFKDYKKNLFKKRFDL
jgi:adenylate cyclase class IV